MKDNVRNDVAVTSFKDNFRGTRICNNWQWSVFEQPQFQQKGGEIVLNALPSKSGAFLGTKTISGTYNASVKIKVKRTNAAAGIGIIGDEKNTLSTLYKKGVIRVVQLKDGKETELDRKSVTVKNKLIFTVTVTNGKDISFLYNTGKRYEVLNNKPVDGSFLPPWDRSLRVGVIAKGNANEVATFDEFELNNNSTFKTK